MFFVNMYFGIKVFLGVLVFIGISVLGIWAWYDNAKDKYEPIELEGHPFNGNMFYETNFSGGCREYRLCTGKNKFFKKPISGWMTSSGLFGTKEWIGIQHKKGSIRWLHNYGR